MVKYRALDMDSYPRIEHFRYFSGMPDPAMTITAKIDVSGLVRFCKREKCSFYMAMTHIACICGNRIPQLRQRRYNGGIIEYEECGTSHIELLPDETYCYCTLWHGMDWEEYIPYCESRRKEAVAAHGLSEDDCADALFFISSLPWVSYEQISLPVASDNPCITWGKYDEDLKGRLMMPLTVSVNHALVDGVHIGKFYAYIQEEIDRLK